MLDVVKWQCRYVRHKDKGVLRRLKAPFIVRLAFTWIKHGSLCIKSGRLCGGNFLRISKSCIVQLKYIRSLKSELDRRIRITLENGEQLIASRQYADELKKRLGVR